VVLDSPECQKKKKKKRGKQRAAMRKGSLISRRRG
jgi:hypothetical protein